MKVKVSGVITSTYEINDDFFDTKGMSEEDMLKEHQRQIDEDHSALWEAGEITDVKVERVT